MTQVAGPSLRKSSTLMARSTARQTPDSQMVPCGHCASLVHAWGALGAAAAGATGVCRARLRTGSKRLRPERPNRAVLALPDGASAFASGAARAPPTTTAMMRMRCWFTRRPSLGWQHLPLAVLAHEGDL